MYLFTLLNKACVLPNKNKKIIPKKEFEEILSAKQIVEKAEKQSKDIIAQSIKKGEILREEEKEKGYQEGLTQWYQHCLVLEAKLHSLQDQIQKLIIPVILQATKKIIGKELEQNPNCIISIIMQAIKSVSQCKLATIFVNPKDFATISENKNQLQNKFEQLSNLVIEENSDVEEGGCIIQTEKGMLNATLENQYKALEKALKAQNS